MSNTAYQEAGKALASIPERNCLQHIREFLSLADAGLQMTEDQEHGWQVLMEVYSEAL